MIAELAQAHGRQLRYAQLDNYHWSRAQASVDLIDLHLAGLVALTDRALRNSELEAWSLEEFQATLPPLARVSLILGLQLPNYDEGSVQLSRPASTSQVTQVTGGREAAESSELSEAQIAAHWREEEYYPLPASFVRQANAADPAILERFAEDKFPDCFKEYADLLSWDQYWHTTLDTGNAPFHSVRRRPTERQLQLRGPPRSHLWQQGGSDLGARTGVGGARRCNLPRSVPPGQRDGSSAAGLLRPQGGQPGHAAHADSPELRLPCWPAPGSA